MWADESSLEELKELKTYNEEKTNLCQKNTLIYKLGPELTYDHAIKYCSSIGAVHAIIKDETTWKLINNQTFGRIEYVGKVWNGYNDIKKVFCIKVVDNYC